LGIESGNWEQAVSESSQTSPQSGGEETIVADRHEVFGQDMLQETVDELLRAQGTTFLDTSLSVAIAKGHAVILQLEETVVANGDAENVRRQIFQGIQTRAHCFTVHDPVLLPNFCRDTGIPIGVTQCLLQFVAEDAREGSYGQ